MSARRTLLIEIGCEEVPARMLPAAARDLASIVAGILDRAGLHRGEPRELWTPRRLAVVVPDVDAGTRAERTTMTGPPRSAAWDDAGNPTRAAEGFAKRHGVPVEELQLVENEKGSYAAVVVDVPARGVGEVLADSFAPAVARMTFPKTMRWGDGSFTFVRPVHWLVALADDEVLSLSLFGVEAGRTSVGHRLIAPGPVEIPTAADYEKSLASAGVIADPVERRERLADRLAIGASEAGGEIVADEALLAETSDMVEYPGAVAGEFERRFVDSLPLEVLRTCLRHHQRAFMVRSDDGALPAFAVAVNASSDPEGHIRRGNEWVVSGRLEDAAFFWQEDRKRPLADRADSLAGITFQRELGSYAEKTERVARLARGLGRAHGLEEDALETLGRAARLSRCDLVTGLVGEFPELQGVAGGLLARADGESAELVEAIYHLYRPAGPDDPLPPTEAGRLLGLADRLDTLAGTFAIGLVPTGSRDPFALRRQATAAVRIAAELPSVDLAVAVSDALAGYQKLAHRGADGPDAQQTARQLVEFLFERFSAVAAERGARYDEIASLREGALESMRPADLGMRLAALREFRSSEDFLSLAGSAKRVRNLLAQARERGETIDPAAQPAADAHAAELRLGSALEEASRALGEAVELGRYVDALAAVAALRPVVDTFFEEVLVMDDDAGRRRVRLGLLARFERLALRVVDLSEIVVEGDGAA